MKINRFLLPLGIFGLLVVVLAIGIKHSPDKGLIASPLIGKPAPQFSLPSLTDTNSKVSTSQLRGHWYLFNVWGTWCVTCRQEHGMLLQIARSGVIPVIGMDWKDDDAQAMSWLAQLGNPYQVVAIDRDGREAINWGVYEAPESFLVNPQGIIVYKVLGEITQETWEHEILPRVQGRQAAR